MDSLEYLLQDPSSPLTRVDMKKALNHEIFAKLQIDALESLIELLPPADLVFICSKPDSQKDDRYEVITPQSIDQVIELFKAPYCTPHISPRVFENSDYRSNLEDLLILITEGHYLPEEEDDGILEAAPSPTESKRKRKRKISSEEDENVFKDEGYERYWGERLAKQPKKPRGRGRKPAQ